MREFFERMKERMNLGAKKYGKQTYLKSSNRKILEEAEEEAIDLANYAMMIYEKIQIKKKKLGELDD